MGISDTTAESAISACEEFDAFGKTKFLQNYGFKTSKTYKLHHEGKYYDSKAIVGVAHQHISPAHMQHLLNAQLRS